MRSFAVSEHLSHRIDACLPFVLIIVLWSPMDAYVHRYLPLSYMYWAVLGKGHEPMASNKPAVSPYRWQWHMVRADANVAYMIIIGAIFMNSVYIESDYNCSPSFVTDPIIYSQIKKCGVWNFDLEEQGSTAECYLWIPTCSFRGFILFNWM